MDQTPIFNAELIRRYDKAGPRYTSYPTAVEFLDSFTEADYRFWVNETNGDLVPRPLSLYFHIPFCSRLCFYCACNKVVTKNRSHAAPYLERLYRETVLQGALFDPDRTVEQLHWGGGTPTFLSHDQMRDLMRVTRDNFKLADGDKGEFSIEIDPREVQEDTVGVLRELGFNRMSLGVQDLDPEVQKAVNRVQPEEMTLKVLEAARREGFKSVSMDLIYGLPFQTPAGFAETIERIIEAGPDRLSVFNYAHLPELFAPQKRIDEKALPPPAQKLEILQRTIEQLVDAGYVYIGMDHFARPDDELARAQKEGTLHRNFQGYSTHADCDLIGIGLSAISAVGYCYSQNTREMADYERYIDAGELPILRGFELEPEDLLRREIITQLICHFELDVQAIEKKWHIDFAKHFKAECDELASMQKSGLLEIKSNHVRVLPPGRLLIRNICMSFDQYRRLKQEERFSKVI